MSPRPPARGQLLSRPAVWTVVSVVPAALAGCLCGSCLSSHPVKAGGTWFHGGLYGVFWFFFLSERAMADLLSLVGSNLVGGL